MDLCADHDPFLQGRAGRLYREGKGVEKDASKALDLVRRAFDSGAEWTRNDLIDLLLEGGSEVDKRRAFALAREKHESDPWAELRLARMYRDGSGTRASLDKAISLMRDARNRGVSAATPELDAMLSKRGGKEDLRELFVDLKQLADKGDPWASGKIARMYRDGIGTEVDLEEAVKAMRKACEGGVPWAEKELAELLASS